jgi:hypothetical protein
VTPEPPIAPEDDWSPVRNLYAIALSEAPRWTEAAQLTARRMRQGDAYEAQLDARLFLLALRGHVEDLAVSKEDVTGATWARRPSQKHCYP